MLKLIPLTLLASAITLSSSTAFSQAPAEGSPALPCATDMNGGYIQTAPFWQTTTNPQRMYLVNAGCSPDPRLGVGVKPDLNVKVHVRLDKDSELHPLVIDRLISNNPNVAPYKLMQLDRNGLLYAREVKVNLDSWADYVFDSTYVLMPLEEVKQYIDQNNHLPNVPSEAEMVANGNNLAETDMMLMRKVEELTLYLLQIQEQVKTQETLIQTQQKLFEQQQETILLQQKLLEQLQSSKN